jgi:hypothetical protein
LNNDWLKKRRQKENKTKSERLKQFKYTYMNVEHCTQTYIDDIAARVEELEQGNLYKNITKIVCGKIPQKLNESKTGQV